jgi:8-oxo-dGTP pyrophosphatase MutT (NUDIX family)
MPADSGKKVRREHSAGGAVISLLEGRPHVAMIATRGKTRWGLPKGAVTAEETPEQAAIREVLEETGLEAEISSKLETIQYYFRAGDTLIHKFVDFYLMQHVGGDLTPQLSEVDDVEWVPVSEAVARASFESEKRLLERVHEHLEKVMR